jgi:hypothetical protein
MYDGGVSGGDPFGTAGWRWAESSERKKAGRRAGNSIVPP